jgi:hypothetical protein
MSRAIARGGLSVLAAGESVTCPSSSPLISQGSARCGVSVRGRGISAGNIGAKVTTSPKQTGWPHAAPRQCDPNLASIQQRREGLEPAALDGYLGATEQRAGARAGRGSELTSIFSTVVIWSGHIGSREDHALLLGKDLRKDLVNQGTLR